MGKHGKAWEGMDRDTCIICGAPVGPDNLDHRCDECERRYVPCDNTSCRALRDPKDLAEVWNAYIHWRSHSNGYGCSHGN